MSYLSRRTFIRGVAAMPLALWLARNANADVPAIRYDIATPQGAAMLQVYASAVAQMQALGPDSPLSWMWQWYTHFVDGTTTKSNEIARIFGGATTPQSALAIDMWNTCQSHSGQNTNYFLPWHRMYLFFLESIVRQVSGVPGFAMPYWNYISPDPALRGVLPQQFRLPGDASFGCLYRPDRTALANSGPPLQKNQSGDPMDISAAMAATAYSTVGTVQGFCRAIDSGIHGRIHVLVGTRKNMGAVPYAGRDPLFWVHHSSIDRMWASWNANGGVNPATASWTNKSFIFADATGQRVTAAIRDFFDISTLGYSYDALIPPASSTFAKTAAIRATAPRNTVPRLIGSAPTATDLGEGPVHVPLLPAAGIRRTAVLGLDPLERDARTYLVVKDLHTWKQPEVLYDIYLEPAHGGRGLNRASRVGDINFFDAEFHDHGHGAMADVVGENFYSFDVTDVLRAMARDPGANARDGLLVSIVPAGRPTAGAGPLVSTVELMRQ